MEQSQFAKIKQALELAKLAHVGCQLSYFDVIELLCNIKSLEDIVEEMDNE